MAKATAKPASKGKKGGLLWIIVGVLILLLGAASGLYYFKRDTIKKDSRLKVIQDFVDKLDSTIGKGTDKIKESLGQGKDDKSRKPGAAKPGKDDEGLGFGSFFTGSSYEVQHGDNLYSIAQKGSLVENSWEWRRIMVQNRDKIDYAFISEEDPQWKVVMAEGQELTVSEEQVFPPRLPTEGKKYSVQLVSLPDNSYRRGVKVASSLISDGYYAYVYRADAGGKSVYRIRSGLYNSEEEARMVADEIRMRYQEHNWFPDAPWISVPEEAELLGEMLDFGALLINPWVITVTSRDKHSEALADMKQIKNGGIFAYLSQGRDTSGRFVYRTRVGYFPSKGEAEKVIADHKGPLWETAVPEMVIRFEEASPGQLLRLQAEK
ncbi:MAG: SPOR domain-containing protein [Deltaproteobacteria bacterium]|nr:SPOR domain-containing protein [Deltaproteobacteria bacterium]